MGVDLRHRPAKHLFAFGIPQHAAAISVERVHQHRRPFKQCFVLGDHPLHLFCRALSGDKPGDNILQLFHEDNHHLFQHSEGALRLRKPKEEVAVLMRGHFTQHPAL